MNTNSYLKKQIQNTNKKQKYEKAFNKQDSEEMIKDALDYMGQQGYDFQYSSKETLPKKSKQMLRRVYLRFNCESCTQKNKKTKRWTSTKGTVGITFQFRKQTDPKFFPDLLIFNFRIYLMQCLECHKWGIPEIYDSQLEGIEVQFCQIVANIINGKKPKKKNRKIDPIPVPDLENHLIELCQACSLGKCSAMGRTRERVLRQQI